MNKNLRSSYLSRISSAPQILLQYVIQRYLKDYGTHESRESDLYRFADSSRIKNRRWAHHCGHLPRISNTLTNSIYDLKASHT